MAEDEAKKFIHGLKVPASEDSLGGKVTYREGDGSFRTEEQVPHCGRCGGPLSKDDYCLCTAPRCARPMHARCAYVDDGRSYCREHMLGRIRNSTKTDTKVLIAIHNGIGGSRTVAKLCKVPKSEIERSIGRLALNGYATKSRFLLIFSRLEMTEEGVEILPLCYNFYGHMNSVKQFVHELKLHLQKKSHAFNPVDYDEETESVEE